LGKGQCYLKITWVFCNFLDRLVQFEDLAPEEKLILAVFAPEYGSEVECHWEAVTRMEYERQIRRKMLPGSDSTSME